MSISDHDPDRTTTSRSRPRDTAPPDQRADTPVLPHDDSSEQCVIGSLLLEPGYFDAVAEILPAPAAFTGLIPRAIYGAMQGLHGDGTAIDGVTIKSRLAAQHFAGIGDAFDYMVAAADCVPSAANVVAYSKTVRDLWRRREAITALHSAMQGLADGATTESVIATATRALARMAPVAVPDGANPEREAPEPPDLYAPMFHGLAGQIVRTIDPHTEAAPVAVLAHVLIAFGNVIGRAPHFMVDGAEHHANLFTVCVGATSKGRKGTALAQVTRLIDGLDDGWRKDCVKSGCSSGEGLLYAVRDDVRREVQIKVRGRFTGETQEEIVDPGVADKRLLAVESEFAKVLQVASRDGNTLSAQIRLAWDTGNLHVMTKSPLKATGAHISIIGHITKEELKAELLQTDALNGFGNRFLWLYVERSKLLPRGGNLQESELMPLRDKLRLAVAHATAAGEIGMTPEAWELWDAEYERLSTGQAGLLGGMTNRAEAQVRRLAMMYALLDCRHEVDTPHLLAALDLWRYCEATAEYLFGVAPQKQGNELADLVSLIRESGGTMTLREIREKRRKYRPAGVAEAVVEKLIAAGMACWDEIPTATKPKVAVRVFTAGIAVPVPNLNKPLILSEYDTGYRDTGPKNTPPVPPDYDQPPVHMQEAEARDEVARQAEVEGNV